MFCFHLLMRIRDKVKGLSFVKVEQTINGVFAIIEDSNGDFFRLMIEPIKGE